MKIEKVSDKYLVTAFRSISLLVLVVTALHVALSFQLAGEKEERIKDEIKSTVLSYQLEISEKLSILASSQVFIDYLRSGYVTRENKKLDMHVLFSNLRDETITGIEILNSDKIAIFDYGTKSNLRIEMQLCYLNDFLNSKLGTCRNSLILNLSKEKTINKLIKMNPKIIACEECDVAFELLSNGFGSFSGHFLTPVTLPVTLSEKSFFESTAWLEALFLFLIALVVYITHRSFKKISDNFIYGPIKMVVNSLSENRLIDIDKITVLEIRSLGLALNQYIEESKNKEELRKNAVLGKLATQLAHDIRSPLEVLKAIRSDLYSVPESLRRSLQGCINRIEEISFDLLQSYQGVRNEEVHEVREEELLSLLEDILAEKRLEFSKRKSVKIIHEIEAGPYGLCSNIARSSFKRVISNLINNSVEALKDSRGEIRVKLYEEGSNNIIEIADNGVGIPDSVKSKLFEAGFTTKKCGHGIGLSSAKETIRGFNGDIKLDTLEDKGTVVTIRIPKSNGPGNVVNTICLFKYKHIIILDDDVSFHNVWREKLREANNLTIEFFTNVSDLTGKYPSLPTKSLLLCSFELSDRSNGFEIINMYKNEADCALVTARMEELEIRNKCLERDVKFLSKKCVSFIRIVKSKPAVVLIDDDKLIRLDWMSYCKNENIHFMGFASVNDFINNSKTIDEDSLIFIDSNLGNGVMGEVVSENIHTLGFKNLYLSTGYSSDDLQVPNWIKGVFSKNPRRFISQLC